MDIPDLSKYFPGGKVEGPENADRIIQTLSPEECVIRLEGDVVKCLRTDEVHLSRRSHVPLVGLTKSQLLMMYQGAIDKGKMKG